MKTKIPLFLFLIVICVNAQVVNLPYTSTVLTMNGDVAVVDLNNDGLLDFIFSCGSQWEKPATKFSGRYINNGNKTFTLEPETKILPGANASIRYGDVDGNGEIDAIFSGIIDGNGEVSTETQGIVYNIAGENRYFFTPTQRVSSFSDFNNDGLQDYFCFGKFHGMYYNLGNGAFELDTESPYVAYSYGGPEAITLDWDNDGDLDIFITSWEVGITAGYRTVLLRNDGNFTFTEIDLGVIPIGAGSVDFADVNNDGYLDILLGGQNAIDNGPTMNTVFLYLSDGKGGVDLADSRFSPYYTWSIGDGFKFADWNNDGHYDVIVTGSSGATMKMDIYLNNGDGTSFTLAPESVNMPGFSNGSIEVADLNNNGKIDIIATGLQAGNAKLMCVVFNENVNQNERPTPPNVLNSETVGNKTVLSWESGQDDKTNPNSLSYSLYLKNKTTGYWYSNPMAFIGGEKDGKRKVTGLGNTSLSRTWYFNNLPEGEYEWSVQSIDASFLGSVFAPTQTFNIGFSSVESQKVYFNKVQVVDSKLMVDTQGNQTIITICNITGQQIYNNELISGVKSFNLANGSYVIRLTTNGITEIKKIII
jgi:hypothetical protein